MRMRIVTAVAVLSLGASSAHALDPNPNNQLEGSDTLFNFTNNLISGLGLTGQISYFGGGSSNGARAMGAGGNGRDEQEIAPMSRFLRTTECNATLNEGCWVVGGDALSIVGNGAEACNSLAWEQTITVQDLNGTAGIDCVGCSGSSYTFTGWEDVARIIWGGDDGSGSAAVCNSDLRHTLVKNWATMFRASEGCPSGGSCASLTHAWRRDDTSGTTETFENTIGIGGFCNGGERQDNDPIRITCRGDGFADNGSEDQVCNQDGTLGLVLPVLIPQVDPYGAGTAANAGQNCGAAPFGGAAAGTVAWSFADSLQYGSTCPNGSATVGGTCLWPKRAGTAGSNGGFGCIAGANDRPAGSPSGFDARIYNLWTRNDDGTVVNYTRNGVQNQRSNVSYYRVHQAGSAAARQIDATDQIGNFVQVDVCSMGFSGQAAVNNFAGNIGVGVRSVVPGPSGYYTAFTTEPDANGDLLPDNYGLSRNLYVCTLNDGTTGPSQSAGFIAAQNAIVAELNSATPTQVNAAMSAAGFIAPPGNSPLNFVACTP